MQLFMYQYYNVYEKNEKTNLERAQKIHAWIHRLRLIEMIAYFQ